MTFFDMIDYLKQTTVLLRESSQVLAWLPKHRDGRFKIVYRAEADNQKIIVHRLQLEGRQIQIININLQWIASIVYPPQLHAVINQ